MKKTLFILLFFCVFIGFSQEKIMLHGQLVFSSLNMAPISIVNISTHQGTINDKTGEFKIEVSLGDELLFSSLQYEAYHLLITQEIMNKRWVQIELVPGINKLKPVTISNNSLTGNLKTDLNTVEVGKYYNNASFGLPAAAPKVKVEDRRLYTATTSVGGGGITVPLDLILNAISGRLKMLKKLKKNAGLEYFVEKTAQSMPTEFFVSTCGIPEKYITSFIYFCARDDRFKKVVHQELVLVAFFKKKAVAFKQWRNL